MTFTLRTYLPQKAFPSLMGSRRKLLQRFASMSTSEILNAMVQEQGNLSADVEKINLVNYAGRWNMRTEIYGFEGWPHDLAANKNRKGVFEDDESPQDADSGALTRTISDYGQEVEGKDNMQGNVEANKKAEAYGKDIGSEESEDEDKERGKDRTPSVDRSEGNTEDGGVKRRGRNFIEVAGNDGKKGQQGDVLNKRRLSTATEDEEDREWETPPVKRRRLRGKKSKTRRRWSACEDGMTFPHR